jgi:hypothetical protein
VRHLRDAQTLTCIQQVQGSACSRRGTTRPWQATVMKIEELRARDRVDILDEIVRLFGFAELGRKPGRCPDELLLLLQKEIALSWRASKDLARLFGRCRPVGAGLVGGATRVGDMGMKACLMMPVLALAALLVSGPSDAAGQIGVCEGILHRDTDGLWVGGGAGEGEGICLVSKADRARVLAVCAPDRHCWIKGQVNDCKDSGECSEISAVTAVRKK